MYIQLQVKTEVVCIEEEENRDKYGICFCNVLIFLNKNIFYFMEDMYQEMKKVKKENIKICAFVQKKREREIQRIIYIKYLVIDFYTRRVLPVFFFFRVYFFLYRLVYM